MYSSDGIEFYWPFEKRQSRNVDEPLAVPWRKCNTTAQTGAINRPWIFCFEKLSKRKKRKSRSPDLNCKVGLADEDGQEVKGRLPKSIYVLFEENEKQRKRSQENLVLAEETRPAVWPNSHSLFFYYRFCVPRSCSTNGEVTAYTRRCRTTCCRVKWATTWIHF